MVDAAANGFPALLPRKYIDLIDWQDPDDPLRRLLVPSKSEQSTAGAFDTSGETESTVVRGLQHKYVQTAIVILTQACAGHCRYCFRRRLMTRDMLARESISDLEPALDYIRQHTEIDNLLLSGGDPLLVNTKRLAKLLDRAAEIPHLRQIRISTKLPAFLPERITKDEQLTGLLASFSRRFQIMVQCHFDHHREIDAATVEALEQLGQAGCVLSSQVALIKGVNDDPDVLAALYKELHYLGVEPHYLFHPRPVKHAMHFQIPVTRGLEIVERAKSLCAGPVKRFRYAAAMEDGKAELVGIVDVQGEPHLVIKWLQVRQTLTKANTTELIPLSDGERWLSGEIPS